jgi:hypothetical protein
LKRAQTYSEILILKRAQTYSEILILKRAQTYVFRNINIEEGPKTYSENLSQLRAGANPVAQFF